MSFRPLFVFRGGERTGNAERYATQAEAEASAKARFRVWTMPIGWDTEETDDPVVCRWEESQGRAIWLDRQQS